MQPLPHFKRIQEVSLPDFIICSKDRETKPAETGNWFRESLAITIKLRNVDDKIAALPQTNKLCLAEQICLNSFTKLLFAILLIFV